LKKTVNPDIERQIRRVVIATGIASVVTQLLIIREFLSRLNGNEFIIALILFNWLFVGGIGTLLARPLSRKASVRKFYWISMCLVFLAPVTLLLIRKIYDLIFVSGSSIGFYPSFAYTFLIAPYSLVVGFVLPYSLIVIRNYMEDYSGTRIYIFDNIGDILGGALFSFFLVYFTTPFQAVLIGHLPLIFALYRLHTTVYAKISTPVAVAIIALTALAVATYIEIPTLAPQSGDLIYYQETPYGRIELVKDREQYTIFQNGRPVSSSQNEMAAEEAIHYPLSQINTVKRVLMISAQSRMISEAGKYHPETIDYLEIDPALTKLEFTSGLLEKFPEVNVIHQDGRQYLKNCENQYDAIIMNLPEPDTFQINRFFTGRFFAMARQHLTDDGILSFSVKGYDSYISDTELQKISSIYCTARRIFSNVLLLPGSRIFFLCSDQRLETDIPKLLDQKQISTSYISGYFYGDVPIERIQRLNRQIKTDAPINSDFAPHLVRILLNEWFEIFTASPAFFIIILTVINLVYFFYISKEEFVLYTTGCFTMGTEILVIFAFQIFFGYIYLQIGAIITVFLAGLLPGAVYGEQMRIHGKRLLILTDTILIGLMIAFLTGIVLFSSHLPAAAFLLFGFTVSLVCGCQFPVALYLHGSGKPAAVKMFSADLIGAAYGTLLTSFLLIPYVGIFWTVAALISLKTLSLIILNTKNENRFQKTISKM